MRRGPCTNKAVGERRRTKTEVRERAGIASVGEPDRCRNTLASRNQIRPRLGEEVEALLMQNARNLNQ